MKKISVNYKTLFLKLILIGLIFCTSTVLTENNYIILENFEIPNKNLFSEWKLRKESEKTAHKIYNIENEKGNSFLHADTSGNESKSIMTGKLVGKSSFFSSNKINWQIKKYPMLSWRWRARLLPENANEKKSSKNDSVAGIYIVFQKVRVPFLSWKYQPANVIKYVWSSTLPVGTIHHRNHKAMGVSLYHIAYMVVKSGKDQKGTWITEKRNVLKDYIHAFGSHPAFDPILLGLLTDSNATNSPASADYDDFIALSFE